MRRWGRLAMRQWGLVGVVCASAALGQGSAARGFVAPATVVAPMAPAAPAEKVVQPTGSRTFHDATYKVAFDYPADWTFTRKDREISTFHLDARSAPPNSSLRAVTSMPENPFPASTFSGAYVYLSVTPHATDATCARQAVVVPGAVKSSVAQVAGVSFSHGHDEQKHICTTSRDEIYTTFRRGACYRFDLAMNNFCGGQVSGVKDVSEQELETVRARLEGILATVRFDGK